MTPSGTRGVLNDAVSIYFGDATLASAFVARWCAGYGVETAGGVFRVREDEPAPRARSGAAQHAVRATTSSLGAAKLLACRDESSPLVRYRPGMQARGRL
jgi:hypothetical protein